LVAQLAHPPDRCLLLRDGDELAGLADAVAPRDRPAEIPAALALVALHLGHALAGTVPFGIIARLEQANLWACNSKGAFLLVARLAQANLRNSRRGSDVRTHTKTLAAFGFDKDAKAPPPEWAWM
jgi:hypothetical protein